MTLKFSTEGFRSMERKLKLLEKELLKNRIYKNKIAVDNGLLLVKQFICKKLALLLEFSILIFLKSKKEL